MVPVLALKGCCRRSKEVILPLTIRIRRTMYSKFRVYQFIGRLRRLHGSYWVFGMRVGSCVGWHIFYPLVEVSGGVSSETYVCSLRLLGVYGSVL